MSETSGRIVSMTAVISLGFGNVKHVFSSNTGDSTKGMLVRSWEAVLPSVFCISAFDSMGVKRTQSDGLHSR